MASLVFTRGLQVIGGVASATADAFEVLQSISVDDSSVAFAAGDTALDDGGAVTNEYDINFEQTPTRSGQTITHQALIPTGQGNFTIRRVAIHNEDATLVSSSSDTLVCGVDGLGLTKTSDFALRIFMRTTFTDTS